MNKAFKWKLCGVFLVLCGLFSINSLMIPPPPTILFQDRDNKRPVWIYQDHLHRYLSFRPPGNDIQTAVDLEHPHKIIFSYQKMIISGLLTIENPEKICIIGLGGGALTSAISKLYPYSQIDTIEFNPNILNYAQEFFFFQKTPSMNIIIQDGASYFRDLDREQYYDVIIVDVFDRDYIPEEFLQPDFVDSLYSHLSPHGLALINTFKEAPSHEQETRLYKACFKKTYNMNSLLHKEGNRIIFASKDTLVNTNQAKENAVALSSTLAILGISSDQIEKMLPKALSTSEVQQ